MSADGKAARLREVASSGTPGLNQILNGGFTRHRLFVIEGAPGSGKTTLALSFLMEGVRNGESVLYISLSETVDEVHEVMHSHGWPITGVNIKELIASEESLYPDQQYTVFHPSEIELSQTTKSVLEEVDRLRPTRVVFDSLSELRLLAAHPLRYRRQVLALKQFFSTRECTVLLIDDRTDQDADLQIQSIAHGVVSLEQMFPEYGAERRRLRVIKYRGTSYRGGQHDYVIRRGGLQVFPRLVAAEHRRPASHRQLSSGIPALDSLLGGGIEMGTSTLIAGSPGSGKSTIAAQLAIAASQAGEKAAIFLFDESINTLLQRVDSMGLGMRDAINRDAVCVQQVDPAELSPGEFASLVRRAVEDDGVSVVVIDSLNGYLHAMPEERFLKIQLHEMLTYLGQLGCATILVGVHSGIIGDNVESPGDASYLADSVVILRYFEALGEVRQAISVLKKRGGAHERTIREFRLGARGIELGEPLSDFQGVLTGVPTYYGDTAPLIKRD